MFVIPYTPFPESLIFICASCEKMDSIWGSSIHFHREEDICPFGFPTMGRIIETDIPGFDREHVKVV